MRTRSTLSSFFSPMALKLSSMPSSSSFVSSVKLCSLRVVTKCDLNESSSVGAENKRKGSKLQIGSPIIVTEAPQLLKTAASVPCLRTNAGLVKPGDVGRIVSRKPKDVWAVRLSIGTYLLDEKYFKPLELDD